MKPKDKANELVHKCYSQITGIRIEDILKYPTLLRFDNNYKTAIQCAIICVDELINDHLQDTTDSKFYYWQEVLTHLKEML
jgi:hypothetical protein